MLRDIRFAFRALAAKPLFTLVAALSLGLGIGENSAIFSLVDSLWFRPLAVPKSGEVVRVFSVTEQDREGLLSYPEYLDFKRQATTLKEVMAVGGRGLRVIEGDSHTLHNLNLVSSTFFTALGVKPLLGRVFTPQDEADSPGSLVVILGNSFWQHHYGSDPKIVGKQIRVQRGGTFLATVIGVLPPNFRSINRGGDRDLWFPKQSWAQIGEVAELQNRGSRWFRVVARLAPGVSAQAANAHVQTIARRMADEAPATNRGRRASVVTDFSHRVKEAVNTGLALLSIVLLLVMISSVNVANLLLSRAGVRGRGMAVRLALGASLGRGVRQLMTENFLIGAVGLFVGLVLGAVL